MRPPRQIGWVISVEEWALIRRLVADGVPQRQVARQLGIGRSTVARAVASGTPPKYERKPTPTLFFPFESRVAALLAEFPEMPATVLAERVGWDGSISWFRENVARLRSRYRRPDPADQLTWAPGDAAQCDLWFPPFRIPLEDGGAALLPVLVMTAAHSRFTAGQMIPTRTTEDLVLGSWELILQLGRVPRRLIWDNETGIGRGGKLAEGVAAFTGTLATRIVQRRPRDPESKGIVERHNGFFETSFMPGRAFASPADFNSQRPGRRRRDDRPDRPPCRRAHHERRQLPAPRTRHRQPAKHQNPEPGRLEPQPGGLVFNRHNGPRFKRRRQQPGSPGLHA